MIRHPASNDEEACWLQAAHAGDREALTRLITRHWGCASAIVATHVARGEAEDVLQDAMAAAVAAFPNYRGDAHFCTWLLGIVKHKVADHHRRTRAVEPFDRARTRRPLASCDWRADADTRLLFSSCMQHLSAREREMLRLRLVEELPFKAIAEQSGASEDAVKSVYRRALAKLRAAT